LASHHDDRRCLIRENFVDNPAHCADAVTRCRATLRDVALKYDEAA
jgi:hypothetical protein